MCKKIEAIHNDFQAIKLKRVLCSHIDLVVFVSPLFNAEI